MTFKITPLNFVLSIILINATVKEAFSYPTMAEVTNDEANTVEYNPEGYEYPLEDCENLYDITMYVEETFEANSNKEKLCIVQDISKLNLFCNVTAEDAVNFESKEVMKWIEPHIENVKNVCIKKGARKVEKSGVTSWIYVAIGLVILAYICVTICVTLYLRR